MQCDKCSVPIAAEEENTLHGRTLCEDCYMIALSPAKACDPWAVYCAKSTVQSGGTGAQLSPTQENILQILTDTGGIEPDKLMQRLNLSSADFDREIATLRHMEKLRAELRDWEKFICPWS
ncbi:MAG: winged helix-turn-helix domain-containing protein [Pseudomonadota bacterium]